MIRPSTAVAFLLAIGGCAGDGATYPSLAPRAIEKKGFAEPDVPAAVATPDAALDARLAALGTRLEEIAKGFAERARDAERQATAARGTRLARTTTSPPWTLNFTALARRL